MANQEHLEIARKGHEAWNEWRWDNPDVEVDFSTVVDTPVSKTIYFV